MDVVPVVALLLPPVIGGAAGYRTDGELERNFWAGVRSGVAITIVSILGLVTYGGYLLFTAENLSWPFVLGFVPVIGVTWILFIGLYAIGTATIGAVIGGYLSRERT